MKNSENTSLPGTNIGPLNDLHTGLAIFAGEYRHAVWLACALSMLFTVVGFVFPPSLSHDAGWGMQEWRTVEGGGPIDTIYSAQKLFHETNGPVDISHDQAIRVRWWSPGQYLIPGILTKLGMRLGLALTIVTGLSLLSCLLGWIEVARYFGMSARTSVLIVGFMGTFRYSTLPFSAYNGGEILLQGITPWLILLGCCVPTMNFVKAAALSCVAVWIAFFAKLTGILVIGTALLVGALEAIARLRRLTVGMIAAAFGSIVGFGSLYIGWISGGLTPASGNGWSLRLGDILFGFISPWSAGISWGDMLAAVLRRSAMAEGLNGRPSSQFLWMLVPPFIIFGAVLLKGWRMRAVRPAIGRLISITLGFYTISALEIVAIYLRGGDVSFEERHLRAAGMLIFVCVLACLEYFPKRSIEALTVWALSILMSLYGIISIAGRERSMKLRMIDSYSRTLQDADPAAIEFARSAFAREGRDSLFVIPSARLAIALPTGARILVNLGESESEDPIVPRTYIGRVAGKVYVILPTQILETDRASQELKAFVDYPIDAWEKHDFGNSTVLVQGEQTH